MNLIKPRMLLVCLSILSMFFASQVMAWSVMQVAAAHDTGEDLYASAFSTPQIISKVKGKPITKVKPLQGYAPQGYWKQAQQLLQTQALETCFLPVTRHKGWELEAQALFARTKGKVMFWNSNYGYGWGYGGYGYQPNTDFNSQLGLPEHAVVPSFMAKYRFQPRWSMQYSIMPTAFDATTSPDNYFQFGTMNYSTGQGVKSKWERLYQRIGLVYDPILTRTSRVGVFADYVRLNERLSVYQQGCCGSTFDNDLNMTMAGIEIEKCLKSTRFWNALSIEGRAGVAFGDDAQGADMSAGLKYSVPLNNGRSGFIKGGYRYLTYKKKYSDVKMIDTAMDGGFVEMGFIF
ncbi:MAG: hypothetical protein AB7V04_05040 [Desulfomonilaceae bacterium]